MMLSREQRIQKLRDSIRKNSDSGPIDYRKFIVDLTSLPPSSESRFDELASPRLAIESTKAAAVEFGREARLEVRAITDAGALPELSHDSQFKYSVFGGGSFSEYKSRLEGGEQVMIFVVLECQTVIGYALVDVNQSSVGNEVKIIDVEMASRRSAGFYTTIQVESQSFEIGVAHLLVTSIVSRFDARLHTDATHDGSRYVFKSVGFSGYSSNNPCLLETRPR